MRQSRMKNHRLKWTQREEEALRKGIAKYSYSNWKNILKDPKFSPSLAYRNNVDLKVRSLLTSQIVHSHGLSTLYGWIMDVGSHIYHPTLQLSNYSTLKSCISFALSQNTPYDGVCALHVTPSSAPASTSHVVPQNTQSDYGVSTLYATPSSAPATTSHVPRNSPYGPCRSTLLGKNISGYNAMILEALSSLKEAHGSDVTAILNFIEQRHLRHECTRLRRVLCFKLRKLVSEEKLEKVRNCYKIKKDGVGEKTPNPKPKEVKTKL